jgi:carbon monoxide dehydrogenase subunit G
MLISEKTTINVSSENVWKHLKTLEGAEQYIPMVTKSEVKGSGIGATRTCDIQMEDQKFQIQETLSKLDDSQKEMTIVIDDGPPSMKDMKYNFSVKGDENTTEITISNESNQTPESQQMTKGMLSMICAGLKKYHEQ